MRHGKKVNHLGRQKGHRDAMLSNMAASLILHKKINTTVAKAKALRKFVEPIITKAKEDSTHTRRLAFSYLQSKDAIKELFGTVAGKVGERPGGYTRILKTGFRAGDAAEMCFIELVDFNENMLGTDTKKKSRRSKKKATKSVEPSVKAEAVEETKAIEDVEVVEAKETEDVKAKVKSKAVEEEEKTDDSATEEKEKKKED